MPNGGEGGGGYEASLARSEAVAQTTQLAAGTVFNFSSPGASGDFYDQSSNPDVSAVATAASGGSQAASAAPVFGSDYGQGIPPWVIYASLGGVALAVGLSLLVLLRR
jgi:hypothetical protein